MSNLRKAAQDVVDQYHKDKSYLSADIDGDKIEALRQALQAEPENPDGAVLMDAITAAFQRGFAEASSNCQGILDSPPPSVDALIAEAIEAHDNKNLLIKSVNMRTQAQPYLDELLAEIDGLERIDFDDGGCDYPCSDGDNYRFDDVRAVLNKYRSAK